jgi:hypothetical protein
MTDPRTDLEDIIDAAEKIERFTNGMSYEAFVEDEKTVDAVLRNFEVMGEATKNLPESSRKHTTTSRGRKWRGCGIGSSTATRPSIWRSSGRRSNVIFPRFSPMYAPSWPISTSNRREAFDRA